MNARVIENILALRDSDESGALLIGFCTELRHFLELSAGSKRAVFFSVSDYIFGNAGVDSGYMREQRRRSGVDIRADGVDAVFDRTVKRFAEFFFRHIVLILTDAECFRVDFDKLGERVLKSAGYRNRASERNIELRELFRRKL